MFKIIGIELLQPPSNAVCMMSEEQLDEGNRPDFT